MPFQKETGRKQGFVVKEKERRGRRVLSGEEGENSVVTPKGTPPVGLDGVEKSHSVKKVVEGSVPIVVWAGRREGYYDLKSITVGGGEDGRPLVGLKREDIKRGNFLMPCLAERRDYKGGLAKNF